MENGDLAVSERKAAAKGRKRGRRSSRRLLWVALPLVVFLFVLVFTLISRLSAQKVGSKRGVELASGVPIDPLKLEEIRRRFSKLTDSTVRNVASPVADEYVQSLLGESPARSEEPPLTPEPDPEQFLNRAAEVEPAGEVADVKMPPPAQGDKEMSMMVYSRGQRGEAPVEAAAAAAPAAISEKMLDSVKTMGRDVGRLAEGESRSPGRPGEGARMEMVIYNDLPPVRVFEGEFLDGVILNRIESQIADSPVVVSIAKDFFDGTQRYVVIPAGSRVVGSAGTVTRQDQARMILSFHRIILPSGESVLIQREKMKGLSQDGSVGVVSAVNEHLVKRYGHALLFGVLDGLAALAQNKLSQTSRASFFVERTSTNFNRINGQIFSQYGNIMPTITVEAGHKVKIYMTEDILMSPYMSIKERGYAK